jgi:hypothetical protein
MKLLGVHVEKAKHVVVIVAVELIHLCNFSVKKCASVDNAMTLCETTKVVQASRVFYEVIPFGSNSIIHKLGFCVSFVKEKVPIVL